MGDSEIVSLVSLISSKSFKVVKAGNQVGVEAHKGLNAAVANLYTPAEPNIGTATSYTCSIFAFAAWYCLLKYLVQKLS
jgi:hypothetical protein